MNPQEASDLLTQFLACAQLGKGFDLATGQCCDPGACISGYTPPGGVPGGLPPGLPSLPPPGGTIPGIGTTVVPTAELDQLKADREKLRGQRWIIGAIAGGAGIGIGTLVGFALGK